LIIYDVEQAGLWRGQISPGDSLVSISGKSVAGVKDKKDLANILAQSTIGKRELRFGRQHTGLRRSAGTTARQCITAGLYP
jgi:hypothetical protein